MRVLVEALNPDAPCRAVSRAFSPASSQGPPQRQALGWQPLQDGRLFGSHISPSHLSLITSGLSSPQVPTMVKDPQKRLSTSTLPFKAGQPLSSQESKKNSFSKEKAFRSMDMLSKCPWDNFFPKVAPKQVRRSRAGIMGTELGSGVRGIIPGACVALTSFWATPGVMAHRWAEPASSLSMFLSSGPAGELLLGQAPCPIPSKPVIPGEAWG